MSRGAAHAHREPRSRSREKFASPTFARGGDRVSIEAVKRRARDADARGIDTLRGVEGEKTSGTSGKSCRGATTRSNRRKSHRGCWTTTAKAASPHRRFIATHAGTAPRPLATTSVRPSRASRWCSIAAATSGRRSAPSHVSSRCPLGKTTSHAACSQTCHEAGSARIHPARRARYHGRGRGARAAALHHSHRARAATQTLAPRRAESRRQRQRRLAHQVDVAGARPGRPEPERADQAETLTLRAERAVAQHERARDTVADASPRGTSPGGTGGSPSLPALCDGHTRRAQRLSGR